MEPAVEIVKLSKRYRGGGALIPLPHRFGARFLERRGKPRAEDVDDELGDEFGEDDEEEPVEDELAADTAEVWALRDVSLEVAPGTRLGIIGRDGSGKTTLINILGRTSVPTEGKVILRGRVAPLLRTASALLYGTISGADNVVHVGRLIGIPSEEALGCVDGIAELAEIGDKIHERVKTYSSGELQRFGFAIMLGLRPDILLSDGVVAVGDHHFRQRCIEHMKRTGEEGLTLLFASHNMDMVRQLCTEAILLEEGRIVQRGPVDEVIGHYERRPAPTTTLEAELDAVPEEAEAPGVSAAIFSATGQPVDLLHAADEALVELEFEVAEAPTAMRCVLLLTGADVLLRSVQAEMFDVEEPGRYRVSARLPPGLLPDGAYSARVGVLRFGENGRELVHRRDKAFRFEVFGGEPVPADEARPRGGKRNISLSWSVDRA